MGSDPSETRRSSTAILAGCLERVPRPEPNWEAGAGAGGAGEPRGRASLRTRPAPAVRRRPLRPAPEPAARAGRRGRGHAALPAGRPPHLDRLARIRAPLGAHAAGRVRRARVLRRHRAAGRDRRRPAAAMQLYGPPLPVARQGRRRRRGRSTRSRGRRSRREAISPTSSSAPAGRAGCLRAALAVLERCCERARGTKHRRSPARSLERCLDRARPARLELSVRNVRFRPLRLRRRRSPRAWLKLRALRWDVTRSSSRTRPGSSPSPLSAACSCPSRIRRRARSRRSCCRRREARAPGGRERRSGCRGCSAASRGSASIRS